MTALWLGGTSSACTEALIVTLVAKTRGYPVLSICGIITDPIAEVSATADPEIPLRNVVARTLTADSPPRMRTSPDQHIGEGHQAARHAAFRHDRAGEHKKRDRQHGEFADAARYLKHHRLERDADPIGAGERSETERVGDRHAERKAEEKGPDDDQDFHLPRLRSGVSAAPLRRPAAGRPISRRSATKSRVMAPPIGIGR